MYTSVRRFAAVLLTCSILVACSPSNADSADGDASEQTQAVPSAVTTQLPTTTTTTPATTTTLPPPRELELAVTGDLLLHDPVQRAGRTADGSYDFTPMFAEIAPILQEADLALCHLEVTLSPDNSRLSGYPMFRAPFELADAIAAAGWDGCSLASNHSLDAGPDGVTATLDHLDRAGVGHTGTARSAEEAERTRLYETNGVQVGHLSYSYGFNGLRPPVNEPWRANETDPDAILAAAARARADGAELVVLSMHWGVEYVHQPTAEQQSLAELLLASPDVDLIIGHHAHVVQPVARIGEKVVVYGLGNFLSNQSAASGRAAATQDGVIVRLRIQEVSPQRFLVTEVDAVPTTVERPTYVVRLADPRSVPFERTMENLLLLGGWALVPSN